MLSTRKYKFFDNLAISAACGRFLPDHREGKTCTLAEFIHVVQKRNRRPSDSSNSNVSNILTLTTLRTIDLGGQKNADPLFSGFCGEMGVFFEVDSAPQSVHQAIPRRTSPPKPSLE